MEVKMTSAKIYKSISTNQVVTDRRSNARCCVGSCLHESTNKIIVCEDKKSNKLTIDNQQQKLGQKIKVDGCLFTDTKNTEKRCDYLFLLYENRDTNDDNKIVSMYYIELKSSDAQKALKQLESTHRILDPILTSHRQADCKKHFIITGRNKVQNSDKEKDRLRAKNIALKIGYNGIQI